MFMNGMSTEVLQAEKTHQYPELMPIPVKIIAAPLLRKESNIADGWIVPHRYQMVP